MTKRLRANAKIGANNGLDAHMQAVELGRTLSSIMDQFGDQGNLEDITIEALKPTFEKSQVYCPVDTGEMLNSGYLEKTGFRGSPRVEIGYGKGGYPHYTGIVHEDLGMRHKAPTRAKWLQAAVMEDLVPIYERITVGLNGFMNGGSKR